MAKVCGHCLTTTPKLTRGMCPRCNHTDDRTRRPSASHRYPTEYRNNRKLVLAGNPECYCGCGRQADTADHITPRERGGGHSLDNLRPAHHTCNSGRRDG